MRPYSRFSRLVIICAAGLVFVGSGSTISAQTTTTTTTLTPAQQAAKAKALHDAQVAATAKSKADHDAQIAATAKARAQHDAEVAAAAKGRAQHDAEVAAGAQARAQRDEHVADTSNAKAEQVLAHPSESQRPRNPWDARPAVVAPQAAAGPTAAAQPAAAATTGTVPTKGHFWDAFTGGSTTGATTSGATSNGGQPSIAGGGTTSALRTTSSNTFAAGIYRFTVNDTSAVVYGCLRKDTRVFCDYDEFKGTVGQANANWGAQMVLTGGRMLNQHSATYVDPDGNSFPTAELNPTTGVRMLVEYDDVPLAQSSVVLVVGSQRSPNVPITDMGLQANGNLAPRAGSGTYGQTGAASAGQVGTGVAGQVNNAQTNVGNAVQNGTGKLNNASQTITDQKKKWNDIFNSAKGAVTTKPQ